VHFKKLTLWMVLFSEMERRTLETLVVLVDPELWCNLDLHVLWIDGEEMGVEERVNITPQDETTIEVMFSSSRKTLNVCRLEHLWWLWPEDCAFSTNSFEKAESEFSLPPASEHHCLFESTDDFSFSKCGLLGTKIDGPLT